MRIIDTFSLSTRMFKTRTLRTFLTILGVSVGIGAVLFLVSLGYGLQKVILSQITTADSLLSLEVAGASDIISLTNRDVEEISQIDNVIETSPLVSLPAQLSYSEFTGDGIVYAINHSYFRLSGIEPSQGRLFSDEAGNNLVISSAGAQLFGLSAEEILGKDIYINFLLNNNENEQGNVSYKKNEPYKIIGVVDDLNSNYIYIPQKTISEMKIDNYDKLKVKVSAHEYMEGVKNAIGEKGFITSSLSDTIDQANKVFKLVQIVLALFGLIALSVSAIGMFNTMTISLLERINEIGIMRAIGVTRRDIRKLFLIESVMMGFLGGVGGVAIGYIAAVVANFGINLLAKNFGGQALDLFYQPTWFVLFILGFSTVMGFITGVYPSIKASKINPLTALRYK